MIYYQYFLFIIFIYHINTYYNQSINHIPTFYYLLVIITKIVIKLHGYCFIHMQIEKHK